MRQNVTKLFDLFIDNYSFISGYSHLVTEEQVLARINSGDCGTASLAVGKALEDIYGYNVIYHNAETSGGDKGHAFIEVDGLFYDTMDTGGVEDKFKLQHLVSSSMEFDLFYTLPYKEHLPAWVHETDDVGALILDKFSKLATGTHQ